MFCCNIFVKIIVITKTRGQTFFLSCHLACLNGEWFLENLLVNSQIIGFHSFPLPKLQSH